MRCHVQHSHRGSTCPPLSFGMVSQSTQSYMLLHSLCTALLMNFELIIFFRKPDASTSNDLVLIASALWHVPLFRTNRTLMSNVCLQESGSLCRPACQPGNAWLCPDT